MSTTSDKAAAPLGIAVTGASGLIGTRLRGLLCARGHRVWGLQRGIVGAGEAMWNPETGEVRTPGRVDVVVHLAGRTVAQRWTARVRREIWESRVPATDKLCRFLGGLPAEGRPRLLIAASAVGIYGDRGEEVLTEASAPAALRGSFLADVCRAWEGATRAAELAGIRVIHLRIGVVLSREGGALAKLLLPVKLGLGGPIGRGTQWMPWISLTDLGRLLVVLTESETFSGVLNGVAPEPVRQHAFMRAIGKAVHRPTIFPMPRLVVKAVFGEMGQEVLLGSQRVVSERMPEGFRFEHPTLEGALRGELRRGTEALRH